MKEKIPYHKNMQTIYFDFDRERKGQVKICKSVIKSSSTILSQKLISYMKKGGDINNLTPDKIFIGVSSKIENNHQSNF